MNHEAEQSNRGGHYRLKDNTSTTKVVARYKTGIVQLALFYSESFTQELATTQ